MPKLERLAGPTSGAFRSPPHRHRGRGGNRSPARHGESGDRGHSKLHGSSGRISLEWARGLASGREPVWGPVPEPALEQGQGQVWAQGRVLGLALALVLVLVLVPVLALVLERGGTGSAVVLGSG